MCLRALCAPCARETFLFLDFFSSLNAAFVRRVEKIIIATESVNVVAHRCSAKS